MEESLFNKKKARTLLTFIRSIVNIKIEKLNPVKVMLKVDRSHILIVLIVGSLLFSLGCNL